MRAEPNSRFYSTARFGSVSCLQVQTGAAAVLERDSVSNTANPGQVLPSCQRADEREAGAAHGTSESTDAASCRLLERRDFQGSGLERQRNERVQAIASSKCNCSWKLLPTEKAEWCLQRELWRWEGRVLVYQHTSVACKIGIAQSAQPSAHGEGSLVP